MQALFVKGRCIMEKLNIKITMKNDSLFHDSRSDCQTLAKMIMMLVNSVNELIDNQNRLEEIVERLGSN